MSQLRLHDQLIQLFSERNIQNLKACLEHPDFQSFLNKHSLQVPLKELVLAFTHTSFSHEYDVPHQEQLEFFGDAVVGLIVTQELIKLYPQEKEGKLSKLRSSIVNEKTLATVARHLGLGELLLVGKGEYKKDLHKMDTVLADTVEALMAKVFNHHGLENAGDIFLAWLRASAPDVFKLENLEVFDAKSKLQEATLGKYKILPRYSAEASGDKFKVQLWLQDKLLDEGIFSSKKIGERELARRVLEKKDF